MKRLSIIFIVLMSIGCGQAQNAPAANGNKNLQNVNESIAGNVQNSASNNDIQNNNLTAENNFVDERPKSDWTGHWQTASRYSPSSIDIKNAAVDKFTFEINAMTGANTGGLGGTAKVTGNTASYDDGKGCLLTFNNKGKSIVIKQNDKCSEYLGNNVSMNGEYFKGVPEVKEKTLVDLKVLPNAALDKQFKSLVGKDYESFMDDFQLINDEKDLDGFGATVFSGCVEGVCPYNAGIIMFDKKGNIWAAVTNLDKPKTTDFHYYTNAADWTNKLPKTIESWVDDKKSMNENSTVVYMNKK